MNWGLLDLVYNTSPKMCPLNFDIKTYYIFDNFSSSAQTANVTLGKFAPNTSFGSSVGIENQPLFGGKNQFLSLMIHEKIEKSEKIHFPIATELNIKDVLQPGYHFHSKTCFFLYIVGLQFLSG